MILSDEDVAAFRADGFVRVRNVFSAAEIELIRTTDPLESVWSDPRIVEMARILLGGTPVYYLWSTFDARSSKPVQNFSRRHLHHDATGMPENIYNRYHGVADFPAIRFGIYFQDYSRLNYSGRLKVSPGSHRFDTSDFDEYALPYVNVAVVPGDVVVFTKRLLHSGHSLLLRDHPEVALSPCAENTLLQHDPERFLPPPDLRESMFVDFCDHSETADLHIRAMTLNGNPNSRLASRIGPEFLERARTAGVDLRIDSALIECCDAVLKQVKPNGKVGPSALPAIGEFLRLKPLVTEKSPHFPLWTGLREGAEGCLDAIDRLVRYRSSAGKKIKDEHMVSSIDMDMLARLEAAAARGEYGAAAAL